jgi:predicted HNH restriction endonuclease
MDKLNIYGQDQLKKMMVDVKSFHEKGNGTLESKRDSKSAMAHKKILKKSKLFVKKSFILQNKENNFGKKKINLKFNKKEKNFEKLNEVAQ